VEGIPKNIQDGEHPGPCLVGEGAAPTHEAKGQDQLLAGVAHLKGRRSDLVGIRYPLDDREAKIAEVAATFVGENPEMIDQPSSHGISRHPNLFATIDRQMVKFRTYGRSAHVRTFPWRPHT
jgi:hypothetical protein